MAEHGEHGAHGEHGEQGEHGHRAADASPLDALDRRLIRELVGDPRLSAVEIARRLGVVRATVQTRLDRLARRGVLAGGGIALDVSRIGFPLTAYVALQIRQGRGADVQTRLATFPEVLEVHTTAGAFDVMCRVAARSGADLQHTIDQIVDHPAIVRANTSIVLSTPMTYRVLPLVERGPAERP